MSDDRPSLGRQLRRIWPVAVLVTVLGICFFWLEWSHKDQFIEEDLRFLESIEGDFVGVEICLPRISKAHWARIAREPKMRLITLDGAVRLDRGIEQLESLPSLQALTIQHSESLEAFDLTELELPTLEVLAVQHSGRITPEMVDWIIGCRGLKTLAVVNTPITIEEFARLRTARTDLSIQIQPTNLLTKSGSAHSLSGLQFESPEEFAEIEPYLDLPHNWPTGVWSAATGIEDRFRSGEDVTLVGDQLEMLFPMIMSRFPDLKSLVISKGVLSADLPQWTTPLEAVTFSSLWPGSSLAAFSDVTTLRSLSVHLLSERPGDGYRLLETCPKLEAVWLDEIPLELEDVEALSRLDHLRVLSLTGKRRAPFTEELLQPLLGTWRPADLDELSIHNHTLSDQAVNQLREKFHGAYLYFD